MLQEHVNNTVNVSDFPWTLKLAGVTPLYKKELKIEKANYHTISVLPNLSEIFENILDKQMTFF